MRTINKAGFTLLEVLIYSAMVGIIMTGVVMLLVVTLSINGQVRATIILEENLRFAVNRMGSMVNQAETITTPLIGASDTQLILSMSEPTLDPTIISLSDGTIYIQQGASQPEALISDEVDVQSLNFIRASTTSPMVRMVVYGRLRDSIESYPDLTVTTTAMIRR